MVWDERYRIGDGEQTTDSAAQPVYRSYPECGIVIDSEEAFNQIAQRFKIYIATTALKDIVFTPKNIIKQGTSDYYFAHLQVKIPHSN